MGVGILFLLWTLISLVSSVEDAFNKIWGVKYGRSLWRKITDYTAIFLILPVLMICSSGLSIFMSTTLQEAVPLKFMSPAISVILDCATIVLTWLFFTGVYMLIPNTTVKFKNALMSGILAGVAFQVLQWLFVTGQLYVSKYNAIYGGFAFLPLLLIWMQLVWVICLSGAVLCYSSQNIFRFSFTSEVTDISRTVPPQDHLSNNGSGGQAVQDGTAAAARRRLRGGLQYTHPACRGDSGRTCRSRTPVESGDRQQREQLRPAPATDITGLTVGRVVEAIESHGASDFIPEFATEFGNIDSLADNITDAMVDRGNYTPIADIEIEIFSKKTTTTNPI